MNKQAVVLAVNANKVNLSYEEHQALSVYLSVDSLDSTQAREPYITLYQKGKEVAENILKQYDREDT